MMRTSKHRLNWFGLIGLLVFLGIILLFLHARKQGADENHYLAWSHSIAYDGDLFLLNQFETLRLPYFFTPTGYVGELRNFGVAIFWLPFYGLFWLFSWFGPEVTPGAIDSPLQFLLINWSTFLYVALSMGLIGVILGQYFSGTVAVLSTAVIFLGTPLLFYTFQRPFSSHPTAILLASLFLFLWLGKQNHSAWQYFGLGIVLGWLAVVASFNLVFGLMPVSTLWLNFMVDRNRQVLLRSGLLLLTGIFLGFLPQLLVWQAFYGHFFASPYSKQLDWLRPHLLETLFSPFHGLFIYAPVLLAALAGLFLLYRQHKTLSIGMGLAWLGLSYIVSTNLAWWAGASFGNRYFLVLTPIFALMIGALLHHSLHWLWLIGPCVVWTTGLWLQTLDGTLKIGEGNYYSLTTLWLNQIYGWRNFPLVIEPLNQHWLASFPLFIIGAIFLLSITLYYWGYWGKTRLLRVSQRSLTSFFAVMAVCFIGFTLVLWQRSESQKKLLAETGFYRATHRVSTYDPIDLSKSYLDRAGYYEATGRPELVLPDLQAAAQTWFSPGRQILGYADVTTPRLNQSVNLLYGAKVRLMGYSWNTKSGKLSLYWSKLTDSDEATLLPLVRFLNVYGESVWKGTPDDPFPAHYIPQGYIFSDSLLVNLSETSLLSAPLWLEITFPDQNLPPKTTTGELHTGIINLNNLSPVDESLNFYVSSRLISSAPLTGPFYPGKMIGIHLAWRNIDNLSPRAEVVFLNEVGQLVLKESALLFSGGASTTTLPQIDEFLPDTLCLDTPPSFVSGKYQLNLVIPSQNDHEEVVSLPTITLERVPQNSQANGICNLLKSTQLLRQYQGSTLLNDDQIQFTSLAILLSYDIVVIPSDNDLQGQITFRWQSLLNNPPPAQPKLRLVDASNQTKMEFTWLPVSGTRPTDYWFKDEIITDTVRFSLPTNLSPGEYKLLLEWQHLSNAQLLQTNQDQDYVILGKFSR